MNLNRLLDEPYWNEMSSKIWYVTDTLSSSFDVEINNVDEVRLIQFLDDKINREKSLNPSEKPLLLDKRQSLRDVRRILINYFFKSCLYQISPMTPIKQSGSRSSRTTKKENLELIKGFSAQLMFENNIQVLFDLVVEIREDEVYKKRTILEDSSLKEFVKNLKTKSSLSD